MGNAAGRAQCESDSGVVRFPRTRPPLPESAADNPGSLSVSICAGPLLNDIRQARRRFNHATVLQVLVRAVFLLPVELRAVVRMYVGASHFNTSPL